MKREIIQKEAVSKIEKNTFGNIYIDVAPRVGKSKIIIDYFKNTNFDTHNVLITVPVNTIKKSWNNEFLKWNFNFNGKIIHKNQLAKIDLNQFKLIIIDEVHDLSLKNIECLVKAKKPLLGLSGSISDNTRALLMQNLRMRCAYKYSKEDAIKDKIISDYRIILIPVDLDNTDNYVHDKYTEKEYYDLLCTKYENARNYGHLAQMKNAGIRARFLYGCKSKIEVAKRIIAKKKRILIFTQLKDVADTLAISYHGSSKDTLKDFIKGKTNKLSCCKMLSMGVTIPNLKTTLFHQIQSSEEQAIQKCLRAMNFDNGKTAEIYVLYYRNTVDEIWIRKALKSFNTTKNYEIN